MRRFLIAWVGLTLLGCIGLHQLGRIDPVEAPPDAAGAWAQRIFEAMRADVPLPEAPPEVERYAAGQAVVVQAWWRGKVRARHEGGPRYAEAVRAAAKRFAADPGLRELPGFAASGPDAIHFTVTTNLGTAPLLSGIPLLSTLFLVPINEGLVGEQGGGRAHLTPDEMIALGLYDTAVKTPIPDLSFGTHLDRATGMLALRLGIGTEAMADSGRVLRFRAHTTGPGRYPGADGISREELLQAARIGAEFLLRHQRTGGRNDGRYIYRYDARTARPAPGRSYSMPRHSGTTYFMAQAARVLDMPEARMGALRALGWVRRNMQRTCGAPDRLCVRTGRVADMGGAALTALAAAEVLAQKDDPAVREQLIGLNNFIRSMQREDGELMHVYNLRDDHPVDVQKMYYSGEAAYALFNSHEVNPDERDLEVARRVMAHLTGSAWNFFGSRYFYGEEHWTCQAAARAAAHMDVDEALDFCLRWLGFNRALLYEPGQTPWPVAGAVGVGPVVVPRLTAVASRVEAGAQIYRLARDRGLPVEDLRRQMEAHLTVLMRMRWAPGPVHLLADPAAAFGGVPATQASLEVRNDFVQHAGSAMLLWAEVMAEEGR